MSEAPATSAVIVRWEAFGAAERADYKLLLSELCDLPEVPSQQQTRQGSGNEEKICDRSLDALAEAAI